MTRHEEEKEEECRHEEGKEECGVCARVSAMFWAQEPLTVRVSLSGVRTCARVCARLCSAHAPVHSTRVLTAVSAHMKCRILQYEQTRTWTCSPVPATVDPATSCRSCRDVPCIVRRSDTSYCMP